MEPAYIRQARAKERVIALLAEHRPVGAIAKQITISDRKLASLIIAVIAEEA